MIKPRGDSARKLDNYSHRRVVSGQMIREDEKNSPALSSDDTVANRHLEARGHVGSKVLVPLLITIVLLDVVQVVTAKNHGALHLVRHDGTTKNAASDGDLKEGHKNREGTERKFDRTKTMKFGSRFR